MLKFKDRAIIDCDLVFDFVLFTLSADQFC